MKKLRHRLVEGRSRTEVQTLIDEWIIGQHGERNRRIVTRYLIDGVKLETIAEENEMSVQGICEVIYDNCKRLVEHLN
jgi:predicted DNA-binding protein YlxM (UPF0122 family)